jgi:hypothetical protein
MQGVIIAQCLKKIGVVSRTIEERPNSLRKVDKMTW